MKFSINLKNNLLFAIAFVCLLSGLTAQENNDYKKKQKLEFANNIIHSFGFQYNNTFNAKGKFEYRDDAAYKKAVHPCISYGREYIVKYNLTHRSGWGVTAEFVAGDRDFMAQATDSKTGKKVYPRFYFTGADYLAPFFVYTYCGGQIKASYMYRLNDRITLQPEAGIKLLKYSSGLSWGHIYEHIIVGDHGQAVVDEQYEWFEVDNLDLPNKFMPELTAGFNFLFHTKRDPRHNFILGINGTLGFIDRYTGWQRFAPSGEYDVKMKWKSSFFAVNMGYEFTGFKKPEYKTSKFRKENRIFEFFDFSKPVHSVSVYFTSGFGFSARMKETQGKFFPISIGGFVPEFNIRYSLSIKNGFGFAVEIPVGRFQKISMYDLGILIPEDMVWADGQATGPGIANGMGARITYLGLTLKSSYIAQIHKNMFIQPEAGIKFMPFVAPISSFALEDPTFENVYYIDANGYETDIVWLKNKPSVFLKDYFVPDITFAVNFIVHGKKPDHNFIFGINSNIGLVDRVSFKYHTTDAIPSDLQSSGRYGWKSSYVGFHIGYQWMTGKKKIVTGRQTTI